MIYEKSRFGRMGYSLPAPDVPDKPLETLIPPGQLRKDEAALPELTEAEVVRHYVRLSRLNFAVDAGFYPLGSCTMKYNPKLNETVARLPGWAHVHPLVPEEHCQGALQLIWELERYLCEITGMDAATLQPAAGAHGELAGMLMVRAYHLTRGENRTKVLVPDSAHGTNPATAAMCGFQVVPLQSNERGTVDLAELQKAMDDSVAALMLTNPNTLGLFEEDILEVADLVHRHGGLLYYDGANMNALMGVARPGDMGFDVVHLNLHKTFSAPHGGGGPGSGPVAVKDVLVPFLPVPLVEREGETYRLEHERPHSIGRVKSFYGNFLVALKAYTYIREMGSDGLKQACRDAVLNANYLLALVKDRYQPPYGERCAHEFVVSARKLKQETGVTAMDVAKRLLDYGYHPPTVYFPLIVEEALMIEPTETESRETLEAFAEALRRVADEAEENPELVKGAPYTTPVRRLDETTAARRPVLRWQKAE